MPLTLNDIILKVSSRIGSHIDGDTVLLIEQYMNQALYLTARRVAEQRPVGHEKLIYDQSILWDDITTLRYGYKVLDTEDTNIMTYIPVIQKRVMEITYFDAGTGVFIIEPSMSRAGLDLIDAHSKAYYFVEEPYIILAIPTTKISDVISVQLRHYIYPTLTQFPPELEDFLVTELLNLMQTESSRRNQDEQKTAIRKQGNKSG